MPYIAPEPRVALDPLIDQLAEAIVAESKKSDKEAAYAGILNYSVTRLALKVMRLRFGAMKYWLIATTTGVLKNVADEFYRRLGVPYEDLQIAKSGDVDLYEEYLAEMGK